MHRLAFPGIKSQWKRVMNDQLTKGGWVKAPSYRLQQAPQIPTNSEAIPALNRVWCSGNIVDSHFSEVSAPSTARGSTPRIRDYDSIFFASFFSPSLTDFISPNPSPNFVSQNPNAELRFLRFLPLSHSLRSLPHIGIDGAGKTLCPLSHGDSTDNPAAGSKSRSVWTPNFGAPLMGLRLDSDVTPTPEPFAATLSLRELRFVGSRCFLTRDSIRLQFLEVDAIASPKLVQI